jgi:hypothetical protein
MKPPSEAPSIPRASRAQGHSRPSSKPLLDCAANTLSKWGVGNYVIGAILFWVIDKFCPDARLAQLLKLLVVLVCLGAIVADCFPSLDIRLCCKAR